MLLLMGLLVPKTEMESPLELFDSSVVVAGDTGPTGQKMTCGLSPPFVRLIIEGVSLKIAKFVFCVLFDQSTWAYFTSFLIAYNIMDRRKIPMGTVTGFSGNRACGMPASSLPLL